MLSQDQKKEFYERALTLFRQYPGETHRVAKMMPCSSATANKLWYKGYPNKQAYGWGYPIEEMIRKEAQEAQQKQLQKERETLAAARAAAIEALTEEGKLVKNGRAMLLVQQVFCNNITVSLQPLAQQLVADVQALTKDPTKMSKLSLDAKFGLLRRALAYQRAINTETLKLIESQKKLLGLPTNVVKVVQDQAKDTIEAMSPEEAMADAQALARAFQYQQEQQAAALMEPIPPLDELNDEDVDAL